MANPDRFQREDPHLYLCGMPGAGKSTLAAGLSIRLNRPLLDLDRHIEEREGVAVAELFRTGESGFRLAERQALISTFDMPPSVIALGGGALQDDELTDLVLSRGLMVYLDVPLELLAQRPSISRDRPLLADSAGTDLADRLRGMLAERETRYRRADLSLRIDRDESPDQTVGRIASWLDGAAAWDLHLRSHEGAGIGLATHAVQSTNR